MAGVPWQVIKTMSVFEIALASSVQQEQAQEFTRLLAWVVYNGAALTGVAVNDPKRFPAIEDVFPNLFEKKAQQDWRIMKDRVEAYAKSKNKL